MSHVTLTFEVWIRVKVTAHRPNEDNICKFGAEWNEIAFYQHPIQICKYPLSLTVKGKYPIRQKAHLFLWPCIQYLLNNLKLNKQEDWKITWKGYLQWRIAHFELHQFYIYMTFTCVPKSSRNIPE